MSLNPPDFRLADLHTLARRLEAGLASVTAQVSLVGALRRREPTHEIGFLVVPQSKAADLFGEAEPDLESIVSTTATWGDVTRRPDGNLLCVSRDHRSPGDEPLRILVTPVTDPSSWGVLLARLTGPPMFFQYVADNLRERGLSVAADGRTLLKNGAQVPVPSEEILFQLAGVEWLSPESRDVFARDHATSHAELEPDPVVHSRNHLEHQGRGMTIERD